MLGNANEDTLIYTLREREKELNCLYKVDEVLANHQLSIPEMFERIVDIIPFGWQYPELCRAKIVVNHCSYQTHGFLVSFICEKCSIKLDGKNIGEIEIVYTKEVPKSKEGYFLEKEGKLIRTIADRIGHMLLYRQMKLVLDQWEVARTQSCDYENSLSEWKVIINFLQKTDRNMLLYLCRKMINLLTMKGIKEASTIFNGSLSDTNSEWDGYNFPTIVEPLDSISNISEKTFNIASKYIGSDEITINIKKWIQHENVYTLIKAISCITPSVKTIIEELNRYCETDENKTTHFSPQERLLNVSLISIFFSQKPDFLNIAKQFITFRDFYDIAHKIIFPAGSHGKLGGKSSGMFLAYKILEREKENLPILNKVKIPKTWFITSDGFIEFLQYNNLEELHEQKYNDMQEIRLDYVNIIQLMKNSKLPPEIIRSLSMALDDFGESPLVVRSSSLLEDQIGASFSGKYKSLFLANQGEKQERLEALKDAVIEVYTSVFNPDCIQYRAERGLLDFKEEMGIMIQEVVGTQVGRYFFPMFSGVAFNYNEYLWSPKIKREDGLIRMVPGLGTRAVDRLNDDFPVLISPQHPDIPINTVPDEVKRYSPKKMDVLNLEKRIFETIEIEALLKEYGNQMKDIHKIVSFIEPDSIKTPDKHEIDFEKDNIAVTFCGIISESCFIRQIGTILKTLKEKMDLPVDIEFASDGRNLYLLQCRPQSFSMNSVPAPIPKDIPDKDIIFSTKRYISNGIVANISYIVYVDPAAYSTINNIQELNNVGRLIGRLNAILPKRQFILIGPGRWGSRGDIKLGIKVGYADICNTAALIEVAKKNIGYAPELSFGTHFFQDLVESNIRYLPLYPEDKKDFFNHHFFLRAKNILCNIFPEYHRFGDVVKVIKVPDAAGGKVLKISMNAELEEAMGHLSSHAAGAVKEIKQVKYDEYYGDDKAWRWRLHIAEHLAAAVDAERFGIKDFYLFGSTDSGTAGPGSDIDLLIHFQGSARQKAELATWLEGWSLCLDEMNYLKTGYRMGGLLDVHIVTDEDIASKNSFALKINSVTDRATPLKMKS